MAGGVDEKNVMGSSLTLCSNSPLTGWYRDGYCRTDQHDQGSHTVCAELTQTFLEYTKSLGNDLSTPRPEFGFPGLQAGDRWCLCAGRWRRLSGPAWLLLWSWRPPTRPHSDKTLSTLSLTVE